MKVLVCECKNVETHTHAHMIAWTLTQSHVVSGDESW